METKIDSREITQEIIGRTPFIFALYFLILPSIPFYKMFKGKISIEEIPISLIVTTYISCFCWYVYSGLLYSTQIRLINLIGVIINGFLILIYSLCQIKKSLSDGVLNILIIASGSYLIYLILDQIVENDKTVGKICVGVVCLLSFFQLKTILKIMGEKDINVIPIFQAWFTLITVTLWGFYGYMISEYDIIFPQIIFGFLSCFQIWFYAHYKNNKFYMAFPSDEDPRKDSTNKNE